MQRRILYAQKDEYKNDNVMLREEINRHNVKMRGEDPIVSTTGKGSRELIEFREASGQAASDCLGCGDKQTRQKIRCIYGDGAEHICIIERIIIVAALFIIFVGCSLYL